MSIKDITCLTISLTNKCPLNCKHCGPGSGPNESGQIDEIEIKKTIKQASRLGCPTVNFTGGEPFIVKDLEHLVDYVSSVKMISRITTGAYWANSTKAARNRLEKLKTAGLSELFISVSDAHLEYVPFQNIINASVVAGELGLYTVLVLGTHKKAKINLKYVKEKFSHVGLNSPIIFESPIIPFGRAKNHYREDNLCLNDSTYLRGGCYSILSHPTIYSNGDFYGCAVVFGQSTDALSYGNIHKESFTSLCNTMNSSPLANWIHRFGVVELKEMIEKNTNEVFDSEYVNICHLCGDILKNEVALNYLNEINFITDRK